MPIKFTPKFSIASVITDINKRVEKMDTILIEQFEIVGEQFIADARNEPAKWNYIEAKLGKKKNKSSKVLLDENGNNKKKFYRKGKVYTREPGEGEGFSDWTGNLRSSIGYIIYKDGKPLIETFPGNDKVGVSNGKDVASKAKIPKKGFCLVVVAGMNYAHYVEAKNYDVITGSSYEAEKLLKQSLAIVRKNL
jgi:hypothetical protein